MFNEGKTILILCEESGVFTNLYRDAGYNVVVKDLKFGADNDIRLLRKYNAEVHGILAFPPCTHLAGSGARWWKEKGEQKLLDGLSLVDACLRAIVIYRPSFWILENPVGRLSTYLGKPTFSFHPHEYAGYAPDPSAEAYTKRTCLWGKFNIPPHLSVPPVLGSKMNLIAPSKDRAEIRSKTPLGFANSIFQYNK